MNIYHHKKMSVIRVITCLIIATGIKFLAIGPWFV